ncbi:MAG: hypothetical protein H6Q99_1473 [Proteobacteria bacterium]|nr:hypothetical protein [Pseudomonadota bacterium]
MGQLVIRAEEGAVPDHGGEFQHQGGGLNPASRPDWNLRRPFYGLQSHERAEGGETADGGDQPLDEAGEFPEIFHHDLQEIVGVAGLRPALDHLVGRVDEGTKGLARLVVMIAQADQRMGDDVDAEPLRIENGDNVTDIAIGPKALQAAGALGGREMHFFRQFRLGHVAFGLDGGEKA